MKPDQLIVSVLLGIGCLGALRPTNARVEQPSVHDGNATSADTHDKHQQAEIIVTARRERLRELTRDLAKAEDGFFDAYNRVNTVADFAIHCSVETPLGTNISKRECRPQFVDTARETEGASILESLTEGSTTGGAPPPHGIPANELINEKMGDYKKHVVEVATRDPNLRKLLQDYKELRQQYDAALKHE